MIATDALVTFVLINRDKFGISPIQRDVFTWPEYINALAQHSNAEVVSMFKQ